MSQKVDWTKYVAETDTKLSKVAVKDDYLGKADENAPEKYSPEEASLLAKIVRKGLVDNKNIDVQWKDRKSTLHSVKTFEALNLNPNLLKGVYEMGINVPTKFQETVLLMLLADPRQNLIGQAQPGAGKTTAFVLAMLSRVDPSKHHPQVLWLSPTYESVIETGEVAGSYG